MRPLVGVFQSRSAAESAKLALNSVGVSSKNVTILTPDSGGTRVSRMDAEQPGMVKAIGAVAGGAVGLGVGEGLATLLIPGVGPVLAVGIVGGAVLGALAGGAIGGASEKMMFPGLPTDELFIYKDALRQNRTVLIATVENGAQAEAARVELERAGAESIDRARHMWWLGVRDVEKEHYRANGGDFDKDETEFRRGFEAAQNDELVAESRRRPDTWNSEAFRQGFERGLEYSRTIHQNAQ